MKVKICGLTNLANATQIANLNPDFVGFIFTNKSKRMVNIEIANQINHNNKVGVFVNQNVSEISNIIKTVNLKAVQLHGNESVNLCNKLKLLHPQIKIIKAFSIQNLQDFNSIYEYQNAINFYLFDTKGTEYGGNGIVFNWELLNQIQIPKPYFLSGGIDLQNLENLKNLNHKPFAIDANSKLEDSVGIKNLQKTQNLIEYVKSI